MTEKVWLYPGETANWHFVTLTKKVGQEIKETFGKNARGFGSLPVEVTIGATTFKTSIFPDKRVGSRPRYQYRKADTPRGSHR